MNADVPKRKNLGRGLNALFGEDSAPAETAAPAATTVAPPPTTAPSAVGAITRLPVDLLAPSPLQPRKHFDETALDELAASIAEKGVLQPLLVRADPHAAGRYEIIAGERRWRASQKAQVHEVPVYVTSLSDAEVLEVALIENLQRQDLSPIEEARGYQRLMEEFGHTQERLAEIVAKSRAHVANMMRLLGLPFAVLQMLDEGKITTGQARPLIGLRDAEEIANLIVRRGLSARQAERLAKGFGRKKRPAMVFRDTDTAALEESLAKATGYKCAISFDGKGGAVTISYATLEQLDDIVRRLTTGAPPRSSDLSAFPVDEMMSTAEGHGYEDEKDII